MEKLLINKNFDFLIGECFGRYAKYIIQERALPDVRDGLKPVQRRILFAMHELGLTYNVPFKKSARIVGEVIGKYHPHGDTSVYEALVRMSQIWKMRYPTVLMHGNNGSIDGDSAAAMRYTEARLEEIASYIIGDIKKDIVRMNLNFDDSEKEPAVLPSKIPNLIINGATGIAAGYATEIPPHNLGEILEAAIAQIKDPECTVGHLMKYVKGPDFPTGGSISSLEGLKEAYNTGRGKIINTCKYEIISHKKNTEIIITELPYNVLKSNVLRDIANCVNNNKWTQVKDIRDESGRQGLRIVIEISDCKEIAEKMMIIFKTKTSLSVSYNFNMVGIDKQKPVMLDLKMIITSYIKFQKEISLASLNFDLSKAKKRLNIVNGLLKVMDILDQVIQTIRKSLNRQNAIDNLVAKFNFNSEQASAIVDLKLYRLTSTDINHLINDQNNLKSEIKKCEEIINSPKILNDYLTNYMNEIKIKFASPRRTIFIEETSKIPSKIEKIVNEENVICTVSRDGYLKLLQRTKITDLNLVNLTNKQDDFIIFIKETINLNHLLLLTNKGSFIFLPIHEIPIKKTSESAMHIFDKVKMNGAEKIIYAQILETTNWEENPIEHKIITTSKKGKVKTFSTKDLTISKNKALPYFKLADDDEVVSAHKINHEKNIVIVTENSNYILFPIKEVPMFGLRTGGVRALKLKENDHVSQASIVNNDQVIGVILSNLQLKVLSIADLNLTRRDRVPIRIALTTARTKVKYIYSTQEHILGLWIYDNINYKKSLITRINSSRIKEVASNLGQEIEIIKLMN